MAKVKYEQDGALAIITLNDPDTLNAVDEEMVSGLSEAFTRAGKEARAAVLTGAGRGFSSGANLSGRKPPPVSADTGKPDLGYVLEKQHNPFVTQLRNLPIPF